MKLALLELMPVGITTQYNVWLSTSGAGTVLAVICPSRNELTWLSVNPFGGLDVLMTADPRTNPRPIPRYWASPVIYGLATIVRQADVIWSGVRVGAGDAVHAVPH